MSRGIELFQFKKLSKWALDFQKAMTSFEDFEVDSGGAQDINLGRQTQQNGKCHLGEASPLLYGVDPMKENNKLQSSGLLQNA